MQIIRAFQGWIKTAASQLQVNPNKNKNDKALSYIIPSWNLWMAESS